MSQFALKSQSYAAPSENIKFVLHFRNFQCNEFVFVYKSLRSKEIVGGRHLCDTAVHSVRSRCESAPPAFEGLMDAFLVFGGYAYTFNKKRSTKIVYFLYVNNWYFWGRDPKNILGRKKAPADFSFLIACSSRTFGMYYNTVAMTTIGPQLKKWEASSETIGNL